MNIFVVHNYYQQAGGEDAVFEAEVSLLREHSHIVTEYREHNKRIDHLPRLPAVIQTTWSRRSYQHVFEKLSRNKPHVAHFHNTFLLISPSVYYACSKAHIPIVQTLHNYRLICPAAILRRNSSVCEDCLGKTIPLPGVLHGCWRGSRAQTAVVAGMLSLHNLIKTWQEKIDVYIALTHFAREKFIEGGIPSEMIVVKPNFVRKDPGIKLTAGSFTLFVGRLSVEKGIRVFLKAWERLQGIPLRIAGSGPLQAEVIGAANKDSSIEYLGHLRYEDILVQMKRAAFIVFPSEWYEGFPMTIAEAFACGVPVIASRLGAMEEIVKDGYTGLHFTPGDPEDLAAKVEWAWTHPKEMAEMGREARTEYELKYTAERNYKMLMDIYRLAIERARERYGTSR